MTPLEAWTKQEKRGQVLEMNSENSQYSKQFEIGKREKFEVGDKVYTKTLSPESSKKLNANYSGEGKIIWAMDNDSYLVLVGHRYVKLSHSQLKKQENFTSSVQDAGGHKE